MRTLRRAIAPTLLSLLCLPTWADEVYFDTVSTQKALREHGRYVGGFAGASSNHGASFRGDLEGQGLDDGDGWLLGLEFGYSFNVEAPIRPSIELEFMYLNNDLDANSPSASLTSDLRMFTLMANAAIALDLADRREHVGDFWANFRPFVGAGFGGVLVRQNNFKFVDDDLGVIDDWDDSDFTWGWQVFGGIEYALSDTFSIYGEYKYVSLEDFANGDIADASFYLLAFGFKLQY